MSATQAFADRWKRSGRSVAVLVKIELRAAAASAFTVYASHGPASTPDGSLWEPILKDIRPIRAPGSFCTFDVPLCTASFTLYNRRVGSQASGTILSLFAGRSVAGSTVTVWLWETGLTAWADALQAFKGTILSYEASPAEVSIECRQRTDWNRDLPPTTLDPSKHPRLPESNRHGPVPVVYGKMRGGALRQPHTVPYSLTQRRLEMIRGPRGLSRGALSDTGRGGAVKPRILAAGHQVTSLFDPAAGTAVWMQIDGRMCMVNANPADAFATASESGISIVDDQPMLVMGDLGEALGGVTNPARNGKYMLAPDGVVFAQLNYSVGNYRDLQVRLASMPDLGTLDRAEGVVCYEATAGGSLNLQVSRDGGPTPLTVALATPTSGPTLASTGELPVPAEPFALGWSDFAKYVVRVFYGALSASTVKVYFVGIKFQFLLRRSDVRPARIISNERRRPTFRGSRYLGKGWDTYTEMDTIPAVTELAGDFYWNADGMGDGSPLVAGVPGALLESGPDMIAHMLGRLGGETIGGTIADGPTTFGSYVLARSNYKTWALQDMRYAIGIHETVDMMTLLSWMASSTLAFVYLDRFTDRWHIVPWRNAAPVDWFFTFTPNEIDEAVPDCRAMPTSGVVTGLRVAYAYTAGDSGGGAREETSIGAARSGAGDAFVQLRDENLTVVAAVNDRINVVATATFTVTLAPGAYAPGALAQSTQVAANAADPSASREHYWAYAGVVTANHNDQMVVFDGVSNKLFTLTPGTYSMEALAVMVAATLNSASSGWSCSYSRTTKKFTIAKASGTAQLLWDHASSSARNVAVTLGFRPIARTGALSYEAEAAIEERRFVLGCLGNTIDVLWATGTDGSEAATPRPAASLFGYDPRTDLTGGLQIHVAPCPKGAREGEVAARVALYGARRDATFETRAIQDGVTALETRNRLLDLKGKPRMEVRWTTEHAPDMERGRVVEFSSEFDAVMPYTEPGTDGSWAGKRFVVVETEQHLGPTAFYTKIVAVSLG